MNISMEEFYRKTRPDIVIFECTLGKYDCRADWQIIGTIFGICLTYTPEIVFPRDVQLRLTLAGNITGM